MLDPSLPDRTLRFGFFDAGFFVGNISHLISAFQYRYLYLASPGETINEGARPLPLLFCPLRSPPPLAYGRRVFLQWGTGRRFPFTNQILKIFSHLTHESVYASVVTLPLRTVDIKRVIPSLRSTLPTIISLLTSGIFPSTLSRFVYLPPSNIDDRSGRRIMIVCRFVRALMPIMLLSPSYKP